MADKFLDPIMEKIMEKIISAGLRYLKDQVRWQKCRKEELEKLQEILPQIQAVVHFASSQEQIKDQNPALNKWLWQLRDAIDDADDVLDDLEYMELEKQVIKNKKLRRVRSIMKSMKKRLVKIVKRALKIDPTLKRLEEAVKKLYRLSTTGVHTFFHLVKDAKQELQKQQLELYRERETGSSPKNDLIGRGKEKELVMEWLKNPSDEPPGTDLYRNISLLSIVGHGGMGKTTLLQHVYKDEITEGFDRLKMWVCVSNNFDVKKVITDMLELLKKERPRLETLEALQDSLRTEIQSKKFLLVLDDIWEEDEEKDKSKWENVLAPLASGGFGSKILVTTREDSVALMFTKVINKKKEIVNLHGLEEEQCLELLNSHAFAGVENPSDDHEKLRVIAAEIVKKLLGSPLAAKVVGAVLNDNLDEMHWSTVLESNLLGQNSIYSILKLSYIVLPNHLRNCLAFSCMFPQDHEFDKDDLVRMWVALGFIQPSQGMIMEVIGRRYFDILVKKALFDNFGDYSKMHDLIHESASKFFEHECHKVVDDEESSLNNCETIRHLSVRTTNPYILRKIEKFKHLHSLFLFCKDSNEDICSALIQILKASKCLRLLYIHIDHLKIIPEDIRHLKHLRYLMIKRADVTRLPKSLSNLYHLQYLIYDGWKRGRPEFLPSDFSNLSNLRHVKLDEWYILSIRGIGKLKDLTLSLKNTYLRNINENMLDNLQPPTCLRNLSIYSYMGARSAKWMNNVKLLSNIKKIKLRNCLEWETLPPFGQLPNLKSLTLEKMPKVKWLESKFNGNDKYRAFPLLEVLHIRSLIALEDWFEAGVAAEDGCLFPCLKKLTLLNCPKLKDLPSLPSKLKRLDIYEIGWTTLNFCSNSNPIPLETLDVSDCPNITSLHLADEIARLAALRDLRITKCPNLISLGRYREAETTNNCHLMLSELEISDPSVLLMEPLRSIASLKELNITDNDEVVSFPNEAEQWFLNVSSSLSQLHFSFLKSLQSLPSSLESLSSIQKLSIYNVPMLRELPNLPPSLKSLEISYCHSELKERYREDGGSDRHKIACIPHISIFIP